MGQKQGLLLLVVVCIIATCGLVYELVAGTVASYLLGDSVTQFSTVIGLYLFAMGIGAYCSKYFGDTKLLSSFIVIEFLIGIIGGLSALALMFLFYYALGFKLILYGVVGIVGALVGLEIPLLMRLLKNTFNFEQLVARVFSFDYLGALIASLLFPLVFLPQLGLSKTALFFGVLNIGTGIATTIYFRQQLQKSYASLIGMGAICMIALLCGFVYNDRIISLQEDAQYPGKVIYSKQSSYQRIVLTRDRQALQLHLNGNLQFNSADEYRYHEALVHPALQGSATHGNVLILGGGDGLAAREILKYKDVDSITLVDLDAHMTTLFSRHPACLKLNDSSLLNSKVNVQNADAFTWLRSRPQLQFDCAVIDFPDPSNYSLGKLYSDMFYAEVKKHLKPQAWCVIQCTSPYVAKNSFWCINKTLNAVGFNTIPYYNNVPSFGMWGYIIAGQDSVYTTKHNLPSTRYYNDSLFAQMRTFPKDMQPTETLEVNQLNNQALVRVFEKEWGNFLQPN
ncbi:MAG: hypothetical protein RL660_251 [Bacteroidota bacterium]|jgi:spermidine synthase